MQTDALQSPVRSGFRVLNAQEGRREQREEIGAERAWNDTFGQGVLKRPTPETAPVLAFWAKKIPTDKGWDSLYWWRRGESNPRPQALHLKIYMLSRLSDLVTPRSNRQESCVTSLEVLVADVRPAWLTIL